MDLVAGDAPYVSPIAAWIAVGCVVFMLAAFLYAFVTRYRRDWNALLREWSTSRDEGTGTLGAAHPDRRARADLDGWSQSRVSRVIFVAGLVLVILSFVLAEVFNSTGWVVLGVVGALMEGGAALAAGVRK